VAKGQGKKWTKPKYSVSFYRPRTLKHSRVPKAPARAADPLPGLGDHAVVLHPLYNESAMAKIERDNTLSFLVDRRASKSLIKAAVTRLYDIRVRRVNTLIRPDGKKKAYVRLTPDSEALDVANKIGII